MNMLDSEIVPSNGGIGAKVGEQTISLGAETLEQRPGLKAFEGKHVILGIRPEDLEDATLETDFPEGRTLKGKLELREALGSEIMAHFSFKGAHVETDETRELARDSGAEGTEKQIGAKEDEAVVVGRFGARSRVKVGEEVNAVVDTRALHFFDPETGLGIYDGTTPTTKGAPS